MREVELVWNDNDREMCGSKCSLIDKADQGVLKQFGHMKKMSEE